MNPDDRIVIVDGARTPVGDYLGALADVPAHELGAIAVRGALERAGVQPEQIHEAVMGCIGQVGADAFNARRVALGAGLPISTPAHTVNRLCGSGLQTIWSAASQMRWTGTDFAAAGSDESMSRMPFYDFGLRGNRKLGDRALVDGTLAMLTDPFHGIHMGITAENVAAEYGISRAEQDAFALESQRKAASAAARTAFAEEIIPGEVPGRTPVTVATDEHPRPDATAETLARLRPAFQPDGTVTAGNSSGINDGAAVVVLAVEPGLMGYGPVLALRKLFEQTGVGPSNICVAEVNEAFAAQAVAVVRDAGLDPETVNPYSGAIALGHPTGATGAILSLRLAKDLVRRDLEVGVVTMCVGGGQALAALFRRVG